MNGRTRIGCGLLAGIAACLLAPSVASATDCGIPGSADPTMDNTALDVQGDLLPTRTGGYLQIPFTVPTGTKAIRVRYSYDQPNGSCSGSPNTLDMGVYQPRANTSDPVWEQSDRRGWSGSAVKDLAIAENGFTEEATYNGNKKAYVSGRTTRAYKPGTIQDGDWAIELGIAYVDPSDTDGIHYHVKVETSTDAATWANDPYTPSGPPDSTFNGTQDDWYTGDLHVHGEMEPGNSTVKDTLADAFGPGGANLDFIALVDHNNSVEHNDLADQTALYQGRPVIPGVEVTTYRGHWNNIGSSNFADFRGGPILQASGAGSQIDDSEVSKVKDAALPKDEFGNAQAGGGWTQINHPAYFKDNPAACRGCAWSYSDDDTDFSKVDAIEISNSIGALQASLPFTTDAIAYYEHALDSGAHIAVAGSSDAHKAGTDPISPVGQGATAVFGGSGLNQQSIIDGVKAGHTYVKPFGPSGPNVTLGAFTPSAASPDDAAMIGDSISGESVELTATAGDVTETGRTGTWDLTLLQDGIAIDTTPISGDSIIQSYDVTESGRYSIEVTRTDGATTYVEDYTTPIWVTVKPKPSKDFTIGKPKVDKKKGTAKLPVDVPGAGKLKLTGKSVADAKASAAKASTVKLPVKPIGKLKKTLKKRGKAKAKVTVTFIPTGGDAAKASKTVKLVRKR